MLPKANCQCNGRSRSNRFRVHEHSTHRRVSNIISNTQHFMCTMRGHWRGTRVWRGSAVCRLVTGIWVSLTAYADSLRCRARLAALRTFRRSAPPPERGGRATSGLREAMRLARAVCRVSDSCPMPGECPGYIHRRDFASPGGGTNSFRSAIRSFRVGGAKA